MLALTRCLFALGWDTVKLFHLVGTFYVLSYPQFPFQMYIIVSSMGQIGAQSLSSRIQELLTADIYDKRHGDLFFRHPLNELGI